MHMKSLKTCSTFFLIVLFFSSSYPHSQVAASPVEELHTPEILPFPNGEGFVLYATETGAHCQEAVTDEEKFLTRGNLGDDLHVISPPKLLAADGLTITLRATQQLEGYPEAKATFIRAAAAWEAIIKSPITIILDVDYGPNRFGTPFPAEVLGSTQSQSLRDTAGYTRIRSKLISYASSDQERAVDNALPGSSLPTDFGTTQSVTAPSALWRALGEIAAVANPASETDYGSPPSIGFNSAYSYDFDPSNGVEAGKMDFEAVCIHEIGHALGFTSLAGSQSGGANASILDFFRFAPGVTMGTFPTTQRSLSAGGQPVFYAGDTALQLSTGSSSAGGDGRQTSHWKDDVLINQHIGIMDPTLPTSQRFVITQNDLVALDAMGYQLKSTAGGGSGGSGGGSGGGTGLGTPPNTSQFFASLNGDVLTLTGLATDSDGDVRQAQLTLLNSANAAVNSGSPVDVNFGISTQTNFTLGFSNMGAFPTATQVSFVFIDSKGNRSQAATYDFSRADAGGANIARSSFESSEGVLTLKGTRFVTGMQIEINGVTVTPTKVKVKGEGAKAVIFGSGGTLHLRSGANRVRVRTNGAFSNISLLTL
jgi:hypothetical protein